MRIRAALALLWLVPAAGGAAVPELVADLGATQELDSHTLFPFNSEPVTAGALTFFVHNDGVHGFELWSTDGTAAGTSMVADVCPGSCPGIPLLRPEVMTGLGSRVYFEADDGVTGLELWESDGTAGGTRRVADLAPEPGGGSNPTWPTALGDRLLFVADPGDGSCALFSLLPGESPEKVATFPCASYDEAPSDFTLLGSQLLFSALTVDSGRELWVTDGTTLGTALLRDIAPGPASGLWIGGPRWSPGRWLSAGSRLFFAADDGVHGVELWSTDGTAAGTAMVVDLEPGTAGSGASDFSTLGASLLFVAYTGATGSEIWTVGLTGPALPQPLEIVPGPADSWPRYLGTTSAGAFFAAWREDVGRELFLTDGTAAGTRLVAELDPGDASGFSAGDRSSTFVEADRLFFVGRDSRGTEPWSSDGTTVGTSIVADLNPGADSFFPDWWLWPVTFSATLADGRHLLFGVEPQHGREPWITDGLGNVSLLADLDQQTSIDSCFPRVCAQIVTDGSRTAFPALDWAAGTTPRAALGWTDATGQAHRVEPQGLGGEWVLRWPVYGLDVAAWTNGLLFFPAAVDHADDEAWMSDGTTAGTRRLRDVDPAVPAGQLMGVVSRFGRVFLAFERYVPGGPSEESLWATDGTAAGTYEIGPYLIATDHPAAPVDSFILMSAAGDATALWQLDGPTSAPLALATLPGGLWSWTVAAEISHAPDGERKLLLVETPEYWPREPRRLWSWGASAGLVLVAAEYAPLAGDWDYETSFLQPPVARLGDRVLFVAADAEHGAELWSTDGTVTGTHLVADIYAGPLGSHPRWLTVAAGSVYLSAYVPAVGREIWRSDGTGAQLALDVMPGAPSSSPTYLTTVEDQLFFAAAAPGLGVELLSWDPQGSAAPEVHDLFAGSSSSSPVDLTWMSGQLYFFADDGAHGFELWRVPAGSAMFADGFESGNLGRWGPGTVLP